jgi:hypothetical protein
MPPGKKRSGPSGNTVNEVPPVAIGWLQANACNTTPGGLVIVRIEPSTQTGCVETASVFPERVKAAGVVTVGSADEAEAGAAELANASKKVEISDANLEV